MPTFAVFTQVVLLMLGVFLIIVVLLQRGRGGGLAGAFGGLGGQSAFGTKAGDVFTKITVVIAIAWVLVAGGSGFFLRAGAESRSSGLKSETLTIPDDETPETPEDDVFNDLNLTPPGDTEPGAETPDTESPAADDASADSSSDETTSTLDDGASPETPATEGDSSDDSSE